VYLIDRSRASTFHFIVILVFGPSLKESRRRRGHLAILNRFQSGSDGVYLMSWESVSHEEIDCELADGDPGVPIRLCHPNTTWPHRDRADGVQSRTPPEI